MYSRIKSKEVHISEQMICNYTQKEKYHKLLGHVNFNYLDILCNNKLVNGMPNELENEYLKCGTCVQNKMHNSKFENNRHKSKEMLEIIHTDINGPHPNGYNGEKYFVSFIDDYSKIAKVYIMKTKSEFYEYLTEFTNEIENLTGNKIKKLRLDNAKEMMSKDVKKFVSGRGITLDTCPPYVHELNGTAERYNRSIMNTARCLLSDAKLNLIYWPEVIKTTAYLKNRIITNTIERKTPYEIMMGEKPDISNLKIYGSKVFVRVPEVRRKNKWDRKADVGKLVGYERVGYRVLIRNKVIIARHVDIIEDDVKQIGFSSDDNFKNLSEYESNQKEYCEKNFENESENESFQSLENNENIMNEKTSNNNLKKNEMSKGDTPKKHKVETPLRRSTRERKQTDLYKPENYAYCVYVNFVSTHTPKTYFDAINSDENEQWKNAMTREIKCLKEKETFELVKKPRNRKILDLKWIFTKKADDKYKARIVVLGYQQEKIIDDLYSPVAKTETLKMLLTLSVQKNLFVHHTDVDSAYLNGEIVSEVYVQQPEGYNDNTGRVWKLKKALYLTSLSFSSHLQLY